MTPLIPNQAPTSLGLCDKKILSSEQEIANQTLKLLGLIRDKTLPIETLNNLLASFNEPLGLEKVFFACFTNIDQLIDYVGALSEHDQQIIIEMYKDFPNALASPFISPHISLRQLVKALHPNLQRDFIHFYADNSYIVRNKFVAMGYPDYSGYSDFSVPTDWLYHFEFLMQQCVDRYSDYPNDVFSLYTEHLILRLERMSQKMDQDNSFSYEEYITYMISVFQESPENLKRYTSNPILFLKLADLCGEQRESLLLIIENNPDVFSSNLRSKLHNAVVVNAEKKTTAKPVDTSLSKK